VTDIQALRQMQAVASPYLSLFGIVSEAPCWRARPETAVGSVRFQVRFKRKFPAAEIATANVFYEKYPPESLALARASEMRLGIQTPLVLPFVIDARLVFYRYEAVL